MWWADVSDGDFPEGEPVSAGGQIYGVKCTTFEVKLLDNQFGIAPRPA